MSASRYIDAKFFDFTADGHIIIDGMGGEHLIIKMGESQILNLDRCLAKYIDYYKPKETAA